MEWWIWVGAMMVDIDGCDGYEQRLFFLNEGRFRNGSTISFINYGSNSGQGVNLKETTLV